MTREQFLSLPPDQQRAVAETAARAIRHIFDALAPAFAAAAKAVTQLAAEIEEEAGRNPELKAALARFGWPDDAPDAPVIVDGR